MLDVKNSKNSNPVKLLRLSTKHHPEKLKKIKNLFDLDQQGEAENTERKTNTKIKVKYNETIFFKLKEIKKNDEINDISIGMSNQKQLNKIIDNVISTQMNKRKSLGSSIKVNLNINNNYYNSNYNYVVNSNSAAQTTTTLENDESKFSYKQDENYVTGFLKNLFGYGTNKMQTQSSPRQRESNQKINFETNPKNNNNNNLEIQNVRNYFSEPMTTSIEINSKLSSTFSSINTIETNNPRKSHQPSINFMHIPCINCNNLVHIDEIESHSDLCTRVKDEVIVAESSIFTYRTIDFKLKKLQEHITSIKNSDLICGPEFQKDVHYISLLLQYILDAINLSKIDHKCISELKKILTNIDTLILTHKGSISTLVLIERTRVLICDKITIFKDDYKKLLQTKKSNERKSGTINSLKLIQLEKEKEEKIKLAEKLEAEKEMMLRKVSNLKRSPTLEKSSSISNRVLQEISHQEYRSVEVSVVETENDEEIKLDSNKIFNKKNLIDEITSDIENHSVRSGEFSDATSMTSSASMSDFPPELNKSTFRNRSSVSTDSNNETTDIKKLYQEFVKVMLKVKFEKFNNTHTGQKIPEKVLFKECRRLNVPKQEWTDFIIGELQQPAKYIDFIKKDLKSKKKKTYVGVNMEIISEEN